MAEPMVGGRAWHHASDAVREVIPNAEIGSLVITDDLIDRAPPLARPALRDLVGAGVIVYAVPIDDDGLWVWHHHGETRSLMANYVLARAAAAVERALGSEPGTRVVSLSEATEQAASMSELAALAGLGTRGWNNLLLHVEYGSWLQIEALALVGVEVPAAPPPLASVCIECSYCIDACPVGAVEEDAFHAARCARVVASPWKVTSKAIALTSTSYIECRECISSCPVGTAPEALFAWRNP